MAAPPCQVLWSDVVQTVMLCSCLWSASCRARGANLQHHDRVQLPNTTCTYLSCVTWYV